MKAKAIYLNYNEKSCHYYYTIILEDNNKVYVDYSHIENVKKKYDAKLKEAELKNNK